MTDSTERAFDDFKRDWEMRPRLTSISPEALADVPDRWLEQVILEFVWMHRARQGAETVALLERLPGGFATVYAAWLLDSEVKNGGFQQYFWNHGDDWLTVTKTALDALAAPTHASILNDVIGVFRDWSKPSLDGMTAEQQLEAFSEAASDAAFERLDERWLDADDLDPVRERFIRANPSLFVARLRGWRLLRARLSGAR